MSSDTQSDAIWINRKPRTNSFDSRVFNRSMSVNSEGASTQDSSPPYSPIDNLAGGGSFKSSSKPWSIPMDPRGRSRTSSFSSGYGPTNAYDPYSDPDPYLIHSPLSTSAPHAFRRSNSISVGALEYGNSKYGGYDRYERSPIGSGGPGGRLGPIEEVNRVSHFGDAFKRSVGALFSAPKMPPKTAAALGAGGDQRQQKKGAMQDRVVSMLCESAIR